ncbi:SDR family NAD(P)-dependent oxidoreductase [Streptomyces sp. 4F14]|uniref:SDR family NAD(P)-dependent oxidoreductase n=1 Tax=Streptomyces sp. 4F14 TaxID=3394380 RepID=UPI003A8A6F79
MPVIAIIGAGPGLGLAIARRFGGEGFKVALISRTQHKLDRLATELGEEGIEAAGFAADVLRPQSVRAGLAEAAGKLGPVDVLEYSPLDTGLGSARVTDAGSADFQRQVDYYLHGAVAAVRESLPGMRERGTGTLLFSTGASSVRPMGGDFGSVGIGGAALRSYALSLNTDLAGTGVHAAHIAIAVYIGTGPGTEPEEIAEHHWRAYTDRDRPEYVHAPADGAW